MNSRTEPENGTLDVLVIGAGFAGMYALIKALRTGRTAQAIEAGDDVGGTWYWNRYPGARCDVESVDYSYSFDEDLQREWQWSERYATQPEIRRYANHVADRFGIRPYIHFGERVDEAEFDEAKAAWTVRTTSGAVHRARFLFFATGSLSKPHVPPFSGLDSFAGDVLLTAQWPEDGYDFTGKRVGVIGTGSSGVQSIPIIAAASASLTVFQRSPNYSVPVLNRDFSDADQVTIQMEYPERRAISWSSPAGSTATAYPKDFYDCDEDERRRAFEARWLEGGVLFAKTFDGQTTDPVINDAARRFFEEKIWSTVGDPATAQRLLPVDHPIGTKRICTDSGYFETYNRPSVSLVDLRADPIVRIVPTGVETAGSGSHELEVLVFATGFDALTGALTSINIRGPRGDQLDRTWVGGPVTYLGLGIPGFPNLFALNGPGSPSVLSNMIMSGEQHVNWLIGLLDHLDERGYTTVEARQDAAEDWTSLVDEVASRTLFPKAPSWYMGANIAGKPHRFMPWIGGFKTYIDHCEAARAAGYAGFVFTA